MKIVGWCNLNLADFDYPAAQMFSGSNQNSVAMIISLSQDRREVLQTGLDADTSLAPQAGRFRARIQSGVIAFANLFHSDFELVALVEGNEDRFLHIVALKLHFH